MCLDPKSGGSASSPSGHQSPSSESDRANRPYKGRSRPARRATCPQRHSNAHCPACRAGPSTVGVRGLANQRAPGSEPGRDASNPPGIEYGRRESASCATPVWCAARGSNPAPRIKNPLHHHNACSAWLEWRGSNGRPRGLGHGRYPPRHLPMERMQGIEP